MMINRALIVFFTSAVILAQDMSEEIGPKRLEAYSLAIAGVKKAEGSYIVGLYQMGVHPTKIHDLARAMDRLLEDANPRSRTFLGQLETGLKVMRAQAEAEIIDTKRPTVEKATAAEYRPDDPEYKEFQFRRQMAELAERAAREALQVLRYSQSPEASPAEQVIKLIESAQQKVLAALSSGSPELKARSEKNMLQTESAKQAIRRGIVLEPLEMLEKYIRSYELKQSVYEGFANVRTSPYKNEADREANRKAAEVCKETLLELNRMKVVFK